MNITIAGDLTQVKIVKGVNKDRLHQLFMNKVQIGILEDTAKGRGPEQQRLPPYSPSYALFRKERGAGTLFRDLYLTGNMLGATQVRRVHTDRSELFFNSIEQGLKAHGHHFGNPRTKLPSTRFLSRSAQDVERYTDEVLETLSRGQNQ